MGNGNILSEDLTPSLKPIHNPHPMDSSRILMGLMTLSRRSAIASESDAYTDGIISRAVLRSLMSALHFRDVSTVRHSRQVAMISTGIAQSLGWEAHHLRVLEVASLLHDIGKIGVPDNILFKPGELSPDEADLMALHNLIAIDVLQACLVDQEVLEIISQSHSHYNGANDGFERIGSEVHQGARILAVADAYESLSTDQVYRRGKSHAEIMKILKDASGTQFDGNVISALDRWIQREGTSYQERSAKLAASNAREQISPEDVTEATQLGHIFSYLYLLESLYDGFYLADAEGRFLIWSRGAEQLLGFQAKDMLGEIWSSDILVHADQYGETRLRSADCPLKQVIETGRAVTSLVQLQTADSRWVKMELQSVPLVDQRGKLHGVAEIFRDLTSSSRKPQSYRDLKLAASRDPLTGVANRGQLETNLLTLLAKFTQKSAPELFSVIFFDLDFFKPINDNHGHAVGDRVLIDVARLLENETYSGEMVGRYGGEEFVLLCPETDLETAVRRAERLRKALSQAPVGNVDGLRVTASLGVAQVEPGDSVDSILRRADKALFTAKETGRNRTCFLTTQEETAGKLVEEEPVKKDPFVYEACFEAFVTPDMMVYKLGGFVNDNGARLINVEEERAVIQLGKAGFLGGWGGSDEKQPVQMDIRFGRGDGRSGPSHNARVNIHVLIKPVGRLRDAEVFQARATRVIRLLKAYFQVSTSNH